MFHVEHGREAAGARGRGPGDRVNLKNGGVASEQKNLVTRPEFGLC
jgi:hypothetical protein